LATRPCYDDPVKNVPSIILCGSIAIDRVMNFEGSYKDLIKPDKIHVLSLSVFLKELQDTPGGVGANIAYSLALLGEKPILLGSVGKDAASYMEKLSSMGIVTSHLHYSERATASFNVITDQDDNQVGGFYPGAMFDSDALSFLPWKDDEAFFVISPHDPKAMKRQVQECKENNLRYFYDVGQQVSNISSEDIWEGVSSAELLIVNDYEFSIICDKTKKTAEEIKQIVPVVVITLGKEGSRIEGKNVQQSLMIQSAKVTDVIDPTGAGDAFRSGFLYGYVRGMDLHVCGQMGSVAAVYAVEKRGTQEHSYTKEQFIQRYSDNFGGTIGL
jgi:adenosine kinase